ncbi:MAG: SpoIIE family protein phosphatase [Rhodopila sp.]|jgi:PAS domain S-box-containing protein
MLGQVLQRNGAGYWAAILGVVVVTAGFALLHAAPNAAAVALAFLLVVLFVATVWGTRPALLASVLGTLCLNFFFLPPLYSFAIADPQDWVALAAFLITAIIGGYLSEQAKRRAATAAVARAASAYNRSLIEANLDPLMTVGADGRIIDANTAAEAVTGRPRTELAGTDFSGFFTEPERARAGHEQAWRTGFVRDHALALRHRDGHSTSVLYNASVYRDDRGDAIGVVVAARPIRTSSGRPARTLTDPDVVRGLGHFITLASAVSAAVGLLALAGWAFGLPVLKSIIPNQAVIEPNAAVCLTLIGLSLWLMRKVDGHSVTKIRQLGGQALAILAATVGLLSLTEHITGWDPGIDQLLFQDTQAGAIASLRPGLMAPIPALDFVLLGLALLGLDRTVAWRSRRYSAAPMLACVAGILAIFGLLDFILAATIPYTQIALQTAVSLCLLCLGVVFARTERGVAFLFVSSGVGGTLVRRLLPASIIVPMVIGALWRPGLSLGLSSSETGGTLMIVAMIVVLGSFTVLTAFVIDRADSERRHAERALHRREEELREAQRLARVGSWWWEPRTHHVAWSEEMYRIVGRDPKLPPPGYHEHSRLYTPESFARLDAAVRQAREAGVPYELDLVVVAADGAHHSVMVRGEAVRDDKGDVVLVRGTTHDVTELKQAEEALQRSANEIRDLYDHAPCGYHSLDTKGVIVRINDTELEWLGYTREEVIGKMKFSELLAPQSLSAFEAEFQHLKTAGSSHDVEFDLVRRDGTLLPVLLSATSVVDAGGRYVMSRSMVYDMTERKRAEQQLRRVNRAHRALTLCNQALVLATDEAVLVRQMCQIIVVEAGYRLCWVGYAEQDAARTVRLVAQAGFEDGFLSVANITWDDSLHGRGPTGSCIRTGKVQIAKDFATDPHLLPWRDEVRRRGYASGIAIPLMDDGKPFGALTIYSAEVDAFGNEEVGLLTEIAGDLGYGITSLRRQAERKAAEVEKIAREHEVAIGFKIQQMLLLDDPPREIPGLRFAALTIPSQRIAGDFYQFFTHQDESVDIIVADVMGKGIPAALLGAATKSHFTKALCQLMALSRAGTPPEPREIVTLAHADVGRHLIELESFVTLCYARVDRSRRRLDLVDCGHTGVLHIRSGTCTMIHGDNLPLGIREAEIFEQIAVPFQPGDRFMFFSDGITDTSDPTGERFGIDRLIECVRINSTLAPDALVGAIRAAVVAFGGSDQLTDDFTCVAIEVGERSHASAREELVIRSDPRDLSLARKFVHSFCSALPGLPLAEDRVGELVLAMDEVACNVMEHAYHRRADQRIRLEAEAFPDHVAVRLHHLGDPFDPSAAVPPSFDGSRDSGFGIYLIAQSVDNVRYYRDERGGNCISLVKLHKSSGERRRDGNSS